MLFKSRFLEGIREGTITLTFRAWQTPRVKKGGEYKLFGRERIRVEAVDRVPLGDIDTADARRSGFETTEALVELMRKESPRRLTRRSSVYRVLFSYVGEREDEPQFLSAAELRRRLLRMGGWSFDLLRAIGRRPGVSSAILAEELGLERARLKANVRKLKRLGLTRSLETGYELTPLGRATLRRPA